MSSILTFMTMFFRTMSPSHCNLLVILPKISSHFWSTNYEGDVIDAKNFKKHLQEKGR